MSFPLVHPDDRVDGSSDASGDSAGRGSRTIDRQRTFDADVEASLPPKRGLSPIDEGAHSLLAVVAATIGGDLARFGGELLAVSHLEPGSHQPTSRTQRPR